MLHFERLPPLVYAYHVHLIYTAHFAAGPRTARFCIGFRHQISAPCTISDCKTCTRSTEGPSRCPASMRMILVIVRCDARRKCARFCRRKPRRFRWISVEISNTTRNSKACKIFAKTSAMSAWRKKHSSSVLTLVPHEFACVLSRVARIFSEFFGTKGAAAKWAVPNGKYRIASLLCGKWRHQRNFAAHVRKIDNLRPGS